MNKTAIKNYAIWARVQLIESCKQRAYEYGITEDGNYAPNLKTVGSRILTDQEVEQRNQLISQIKQKGYAQVMEETAYTWFNRFIALRFMEVNGYLPSKVRVFTDETGSFKPEILKEVMSIEIDGIDRAKIIELLEKQDNEELYKYLLITQCNALSRDLPYMFEKISNWTELLFPANLLRSDGVAGRMVTDIPEEDWTDAVQIIGWMYQYYNSELKDETFALLKKNVKITKERIPAATQLFTPDWIVRYMVENSLGRLWYEGHKNFDKSQWKYYLDEAEQEPGVEAELAKIREEYSQIKPEDIKVIDPCMGSGHILVYAFDVLMQIYTSAGWSERDAAKSIIENNLYGLDVDDRAGQLAYFAVMMKARKYSRRIMTLGLQPNVMSIQDSSFMTNDLIDFVARNSEQIKNDLRRVKEAFTDAKEYGSILDIPALGYEAILKRIDELQDNAIDDIFQIENRNLTIEQLKPLIKQAIIMSQKYDVVITNPPYMGASGMSGVLSTYVKKNYPDSKSDLFAVFIERCGAMAKQYGYQAMITQHAWMFLSGYENLRRKINRYCFTTLIHLGIGVFESLNSKVVQSVAYVIRKKQIGNYIGTYDRLFEKQGLQEKNEDKATWLIEGTHRFTIKQNCFYTLPGAPIVYWISKEFLKSFDANKLASLATANNGFTTGDNNRFLRLWFEVPVNTIDFSNQSVDTLRNNPAKWFPYNKGGDYRKWYGNNDYVLNWKDEGAEVKGYGHLVPRSMKYQFRESISWNKITSGSTAFRYKPVGTMFDVGGLSMFPREKKDLLYLLALCNSVYTKKLLEMISPTLNCETGHVSSIPVKVDKRKNEINSIAEINISLVKYDWDSFETSWDFKKHPLI